MTVLKNRDTLQLDSVTTGIPARTQDSRQKPSPVDASSMDAGIIAVQQQTLGDVATNPSPDTPGSEGWNLHRVFKHRHHTDAYGEDKVTELSLPVWCPRCDTQQR